MKRKNISRRHFLKDTGIAASLLAASGPTRSIIKSTNKRPNIFFALADDWSWPHASIAGDNAIKTPTFDRIATEGILFTHAYVSSPSCTPSRGAVLTGQYHWRLQQGGNLWSTLPEKFPVYPDILEKAGYHVGYIRKGWGPGKTEPGGRKRNPAGRQYKTFAEFLRARPADAPFCFWFGSKDPHRKYKWKSGVDSGMKLQNVSVPRCLPDSETVRIDICDYYWEVQRFDRETGEMLKLLEDSGELENTLVVMSGDNGMPFPRCKGNLYDLGTNVPLAVRWGKKIKRGRTVRDFINFIDLAPTFLELAGLHPTTGMTGKSFVDILFSEKQGQVDPARDKVFTGRERHAWVRKNGTGYPMRAIRTHQFLYIRNFKPNRWPAGDPIFNKNFNPHGPFGDVDDSPSKQYMLNHKNDPQVKNLFTLAFEKRPPEELYDLDNDPDQLQNVAGEAKYANIKKMLSIKLMNLLKSTNDPRALGKGDVFDLYPYYGGGGHIPKKKNPEK